MSFRCIELLGLGCLGDSGLEEAIVIMDKAGGTRQYCTIVLYKHSALNFYHHIIDVVNRTYIFCIKINMLDFFNS